MSFGKPPNFSNFAVTAPGARPALLHGDVQLVKANERVVLVYAQTEGHFLWITMVRPEFPHHSHPQCILTSLLRIPLCLPLITTPTTLSLALLQHIQTSADQIRIHRFHRRVQAVHDGIPQVPQVKQGREWQVPASDERISQVPHGQVSVLPLSLPPQFATRSTSFLMHNLDTRRRWIVLTVVSWKRTNGRISGCRVWM